MIRFEEFVLTAEFVGLPVTDQYAAETWKEESFHMEQITNREFQAEKGGLSDCLGVSGLMYFAREICDGISDIRYEINGNDLYIYAPPKEAPLDYATNIMRRIEAMEVAMARRIYTERKGVMEKCAKEYAGYNAAWRYHCTYEPEFGPNPINVMHPALRVGMETKGYEP